MLIPQDILLVLPVILPLFAAIALLALRKRRDVQHIIQVIAGTLNLAVSVMILIEVMDKDYLATQIGGWQAPFGITFIADWLSALMLISTHLIALATGIFSIKGIDSRRITFGYYPLYYVMLASIGGILLTGDIFNMYVWIELMLISSFVLLALGGRKMQLEGTIKYTIMNLFASFFLLIGIGFIYGIFGSLNLAKLASIIPGGGQHFLLYVISIFFLISLGIKAALFPLYFWLPASYPTSPGPVAAIFGGLLAKVGFYALFRIFTLLFISLEADLKELIIIISALTMITAVLSALAYRNSLQIFSSLVVSKIGYLVLGLGLFSVSSYSGAIYYLIHAIIITTNLFLIAGLIKRIGGSYNIFKSSIGIKSHSTLAVLFLINAFAVSGVPPLSGFWGKFFIIKSAMDSGFFIAAAVGLLTGLLTLIVMTKIWKEVFWKKKNLEVEVESLSRREKFVFYCPVIMLTGFILWLGLQPGLFYEIAENAAEQINSPQSYINAVFK
jgi:multicomponent Na+:H+ antiporter subunit D